MKECVECGRNLGIMGGYRHPTMGKDNLLCSNCFDSVFKTVEKYREFVSPYIGFFNKESSTMDDFQRTAENITTSIKHLHSRVSNLWSHKSNQNATKDLTTVHLRNIHVYGR